MTNIAGKNFEIENNNFHIDSEYYSFYENYKLSSHSISSLAEYDRKVSITVHLIDQDVRLRAQLARRLVEAGFHAEIYAETSEFATFSPKSGIILLNDAIRPRGLHGMNQDLSLAGTSLPIIVYCEKPTLNGVVAAMRGHAVNYLALDVPDGTLAAAIRDAHDEGEKSQLRLSQVNNCGRLIANLSHRERQVLESLVDGESNKEIARLLEISPRTVEIHRMKMLGKLGAKSAAVAVKIWCTARLAA